MLNNVNNIRSSKITNKNSANKLMEGAQKQISNWMQKKSKVWKEQNGNAKWINNMKKECEEIEGVEANT